MTIVLPEEHEIRTAAYYNWLRRGGGHGHDKADWDLGEEAVFLDRNYTVITHHRLVQPQKEFLGPQTPRRCRFCGKAQPAASFRKEAHSLPELIGNKSIVSLYECDCCNDTFARAVEDHLAKFLCISRSLTGVRGKQGVPSFKTASQKSRIDVTGDRITIADFQGDRISHLDPAGNRVLIGAESQPFVPLAVFKCFTKMALSIMPEPEVANFAHALPWIANPDHTIDAGDFAWVSCYQHLIPGPMAPDHGWTTLLRRKRDDSDLPYMLFVVAFTNQAFQTMLPCCPKDNHLIGKKVTIPPVPVAMGIDFAYGEPTRQVIGLGSSRETRATVTTELRADAKIGTT